MLAPGGPLGEMLSSVRGPSMSVWTAGSTGSVFIKEPALQAEALKSVQGGREKLMVSWEYFYVFFFF